MYATVEEIRRIIPQLKLTDQSSPSLAEVEQMIEQTESELNSVLAHLGYVTPVDGGVSMLILREMVKEGVAAKVLRSQYAGIRDADAMGARAFEDCYQRKLKKLGDPNDPFGLPDAARYDVQEKVTVISESMVSEVAGFIDDVRMTRDKLF